MQGYLLRQLLSIEHADKQNKSPASLELVYHREHGNGIPKGNTRLWVAEKRRAWTTRKGSPFHCCALGERRGSCVTWETGKGVSTARGTKELQQCGRRQWERETISHGSRHRAGISESSTEEFCVCERRILKDESRAGSCSHYNMWR